MSEWSFLARLKARRAEDLYGGKKKSARMCLANEQELTEFKEFVKECGVAVLES